MPSSPQHRTQLSNAESLWVVVNCQCRHRCSSVATPRSHSYATGSGTRPDFNHPNFVRLDDWFESRTKYYLVVKLTAGGELFDTYACACSSPRRTSSWSSGTPSRVQGHTQVMLTRA